MPGERTTIAAKTFERWWTVESIGRAKMEDVRDYLKTKKNKFKKNEEGIVMIPIITGFFNSVFS